MVMNLTTPQKKSLYCLICIDKRTYMSFKLTPGSLPLHNLKPCWKLTSHKITEINQIIFSYSV